MKTKNRLWNHCTPNNLTEYKRMEAIAKHTMLQFTEFTESLDGTTTTGAVWRAI